MMKLWPGEVHCGNVYDTSTAVASCGFTTQIVERCSGNSSDHGITGSGLQGWRSGESTSSPTPMWPGFDSQTWRHMWVEYFLVLYSAPRGFSWGTPVFLSPQKPTFDLNCVNC